MNLNHHDNHNHDRHGSTDTEVNEQDRLNHSHHDAELEMGLKEGDVDLTQSKDAVIFPAPTLF